MCRFHTKGLHAFSHFTLLTTRRNSFEETEAERANHLSKVRILEQLITVQSKGDRDVWKCRRENWWRQEDFTEEMVLIQVLKDEKEI